MIKKYKVTLTDQIICLRDTLGYRSHQVAHILNINKNMCRVLYWNYHNKEKKNLALKEYRKTEKYKLYVKQWRIDNPAKMKKYNFRQKCKRAGAVPIND